MAEELPPHIKVRVVECASEQDWQQHKEAWELGLQRLGLPPPSWLFDDDPDFQGLVRIGQSFKKSHSTRCFEAAAKATGSMVRDEAMNVLERAFRGLLG